MVWATNLKIYFPIILSDKNKLEIKNLIAISFKTTAVDKLGFF